MKFLAKFILFITIISCQQNISYENRINDDVNYLSNDKLEGRKTGSNGEQIAADYIADRFKRLKIKAKGTNTYFQDFNFLCKITSPERACLCSYKDYYLNNIKINKYITT